MENKVKESEKTKIKPIAYIIDLSGAKFIVEINKEGKISYAMVVPPDYKIIDEYDNSLPISAVTGHYFIPYKGELYSYDKYQEKIRLLGRKLIKPVNKRGKTGKKRSSKAR